MLFVTLLFRGLAHHGCGHDLLQRSMNVTKSPIANLKALLNAERQSIRIHFDYTFIDNQSQLGPGKYCASAGEKINWQAGEFECQAGDIMSEPKKQAIKETFEAVRTYLEETLKVNRLGYNIKLEEKQDWYPLPRPESEQVVDLYVTFYPHPYGAGSAVIASGVYVQREQDTNRPIEGIMDINLVMVPETSSTFTSTVGGRRFFEVALHEMCHVLGISKEGFEQWLDATGKPYGRDNVPIYVMPDPKQTKKKFRILHTPKLHKLLADRWGYENFAGDSRFPVGVELEVGSTSDTWGSHWHPRTYYNELMTSAMFRYYRISEVTLTALDGLVRYC